jgi:hypothetical protein
VIGLFIALVLSIVLLTTVVFVFGFHVGGEHWQSELTRVRMEAVQAERRMHELTRQAFTAMAEHAQRRHQ